MKVVTQVKEHISLQASTENLLQVGSRLFLDNFHGIGLIMAVASSLGLGITHG